MMSSCITFKKMAVEDSSTSKVSVLWKEETLEKIIELYREQPCLYNVKLKEYHNRDMKKMALEKIANDLGITSKYD